MRIFKPYLLSQSRLEDLLTVFNLVFEGCTLLICKTLFKRIVDAGYLDYLTFNVVVSRFRFTPFPYDLL